MPGAYTANGGCSALTTACQYPLASFTDPATFHDHQGMGNWDYILSNKHTLSGRYFFEQDPTDGNFASNGTRITASQVLPGFPVHSQKTITPRYSGSPRFSPIISSTRREFPISVS
jgi:hypothetical protein